MKPICSNQQSFDLSPLPPPPVNDEEETNCVSVNVSFNNDNDFANFQLGEFGV